MTVNISFKHLGPSQAIKEYTTEKSAKLEKYFKGRISITWNFSSEKTKRIAHCHLLGNDMNYFGEASTKDLYASIDLAIDKIEKQLRKHKEIVKNHLHIKNHKQLSEDVE